MMRDPYTREIADEICRLIADGLSLSEVCRRDGMPHRQRVHEWVIENRDGFADKYARARDAQIEKWADELLSISDDGSNDWMERNERDNQGWQLNGEHVQRSKLRSDNRKWLLSKLKPTKYGEKVAVSGDKENPLFPNMSTAELEATVVAKLIASGMTEEQARSIVGGNRS